MPELVSLDSSQPAFIKELDSLDCTNNRSTDTVHLFYVAAGQSNAQEILANVVCELIYYTTYPIVTLPLELSFNALSSK